MRTHYFADASVVQEATATVYRRWPALLQQKLELARDFRRRAHGGSDELKRAYRGNARAVLDLVRQLRKPNAFQDLLDSEIRLHPRTVFVYAGR